MTLTTASRNASRTARSTAGRDAHARCDWPGCGTVGVCTNALTPEGRETVEFMHQCAYDYALDHLHDDQCAGSSVSDAAERFASAMAVRVGNNLLDGVDANTALDVALSRELEWWVQENA